MLKVTISGGTVAGEKTTLAIELMDYLISRGFITHIHDDDLPDLETANRLGKTLDLQVKAIVERDPTIVIETMQTTKEQVVG